MPTLEPLPLLNAAIATNAALAVPMALQVRRDFARIGRASRPMAIWSGIAMHGHALATLLVAWLDRGSAFTPSAATMIAGAGLMVLGAAAIVAGRRAYGAVARVYGLLEDELIEQGVYRRSRNPQYLGYGCLLFGAALSSGSQAAFAFSGLFLLFIHGYVRLVEEPHLRRRFGAAYSDYRERVARYWTFSHRAMAAQPIEIGTELPAAADKVMDAVGQPRLLDYVSRPILRFKPVDPARLPGCWKPGSYRVGLYLGGWLPLGWQVIRIEPLPDEGTARGIRDNGYGWAIRRWDHEIRVIPQGDHCYYSDRITIDAGWLTPFIIAFARRFYRHRQQRWRQLVSSGFSYED